MTTLADVRIGQAQELIAALAKDLHANKRSDLARIAEYVEWLLGDARSNGEEA